MPTVRGFLWCLLWISVWRTAGAAAEVRFHTVVGTESEMRVVEGKDMVSGLAWGFYDDRIATNGWGYLKVESNPKVDPALQMTAAGFLEGSLTQIRIEQQVFNEYFTQFPNGTRSKDGKYLYSGRLVTFFDQNIAWMWSEIAAHPSDQYWVQVKLVLAQVEGMLRGYNSAVKNGSYPLRFVDLFFLNSNGDVGDILEMLERRRSSRSPAANGNALATEEPVAQQRSPFNWESASYKDVFERLTMSSRCTALVKLLPDDLYVGHTTWGHYTTMLRIYKVSIGATMVTVDWCFWH